MSANGHRTTGNGHTLHGAGPQDPRHGLRAPEPEMSTTQAIGAVVTDAVDLVKEIARDGVEIGKLEAKRAIGEAKLEAKRVVGDAAPRVAWGLVALVCGFLAAVLGVIAAFILLGILIPSVGWRLLIFAGIFGVVALFGGLRAAKPKLLGAGPKGLDKDGGLPLTSHRTHVRGLE